jgi:putative membrane protein
MVRLLVLVFEIALVAAIVLGVVAIARWSARRRPPEPEPDDPKEILKRRYAAGEIDEDEYLRRMSGLSQDW